MTNPETYDQLVTINIDPQNDFAPNRLYPVGKLPVPDGEAVIPVLNHMNEWTRDQNGVVIITGDFHKKGSKHLKAQGGPWDEHCMQYTAGAAFHDDLEILPGDIIAYKGTGMLDDGYSGWHANMTDTSPLYRRGDGRYTPDVISVDQAISKLGNLFHGAKKRVAVVIGGLATDYCDKATALDGLKRSAEWRDRYDARLGIYVVRDAMRAVDVNPGDGDRALAEMEAAGAVVVTSQELIAGEVLQIAKA